MNKKSLELRIKDLRAEILALKTAHLVGLGLANFYTASQTHTYTALYIGWYVFVNVVFPASDDTAVPFAQCYIDDAKYYSSEAVLWDDETRTMTFVYECYIGDAGFNFNAKVISSMIISEITITDRRWW